MPWNFPVRLSTTFGGGCVGWSGQLAGVERMLDEGRKCRDVVMQLTAATRALEQAGFKLVAAGLAYCLANPEAAEASGYPLEAVEKMFLKVA